jgi:hypothetical protein
MKPFNYAAIVILDCEAWMDPMESKGINSNWVGDTPNYKNSTVTFPEFGSKFNAFSKPKQILP